MPDKDDVFKRYLEAGLSFFEMTQQRAEAALKDLAGSGQAESAKGQAHKAVDWVKERSRQGTDELKDLVHNEIRSQVDSLGLATKDDVARLEARVAAIETSIAGGASGAPGAEKASGSPKAAAITKSATTRKKAATTGATGAATTAATTVPAMKKAGRPVGKRAGAVPPVAPPGNAPDTGAAPDERA